ncbi:N-acyl homoserine lactonase family protein [Mucilaginibacter flavidus]|uniref:N-acyl homoserine lactonase family protein n=1 Tax=Mucilaginibacter flavidus TaxID=2949309 RepID=UPI002093C066|nr:N-acyl homoserine lactonase family protein [Mucilaginibacter flavidus]MCO5949883.1 N-acyl homoserine lactonase family protein [Mucilaginibacter flavidus]
MITPKNFRFRIRLFVLVLLLSITGGNVFSQSPNYQIYALKFASLNFKMPLTAAAVGSTSKDSTDICYIVYLLKGNNGKTILVDAGFTEPIKPYPRQAFTYTRPDSMLKKINVNPADITDIIITHPHWDHIGGIDLFPNAMVWMQKGDFNYFVGTAWQKGENPDNGFNTIDVAKIVQRNLNGKLSLVKGDSVEIIPGIRVFIGSKHTFECQYVLVGTGADKVIIASDNSWLYYNLTNLLSIPITLDQKAYLQNLKRMRGMVKNIDLILPGHDPLVFSKFPKVTEGVVKIK